MEPDSQSQRQHTAAAGVMASPPPSASEWLPPPSSASLDVAFCGRPCRGIVRFRIDAFGASILKQDRAESRENESFPAALNKDEEDILEALACQ